LTIYEYDRGAAPDSEFVPGRFEHLVVGNRARLLDARRTPVAVTAIDPRAGAFEIEIGAFEDAGARWELELEEVRLFQFARDSRLASSAALDELHAAVKRFDRSLVIEPEAAVRAETMSAIAVRRRAANDWLSGHEFPREFDLVGHVASREGSPQLAPLFEGFLAERDPELAQLDQRFAEQFVSNPRSSEIVRGHEIVLAELGLCAYRGKVPRDPDLFAEPWSKARRGQHIIARLGFVQEVWSLLGSDMLTLYRAAAVDGPLPAPSRSSLISATFSRDVAEAHFQGGPTTQTAVIWRQRLPIHRVFMTFLETTALARRFLEAEAVLIADPSNQAF
jgi:hypothetical protein